MDGALAEYLQTMKALASERSNDEEKYGDEEIR
jgi:hypothetical protein